MTYFNKIIQVNVESLAYNKVCIKIQSRSKPLKDIFTWLQPVTVS